MKNRKVYLYKIWQNVNNDYDTYDSAVVAACGEDEARNIHPGLDTFSNTTWSDPSDVHVELIGEAIEGIEPGGVMCASFNAG